MTARLVATPAIDAGADILVDWLELTAFFDEFQRARVDDVAGSNRTQEETQEDDFGEADRQDDSCGTPSSARSTRAGMRCRTPIRSTSMAQERSSS